MVPWRREPGAEERLRMLFRRVVQLDAEAPAGGARLTKQQLVERLRAVRVPTFAPLGTVRRFAQLA